MPALLTARNLTQTFLLTILFLLVAVTSALLACNTTAQPAPGETATRLTAQSVGENPESNRETPEPQATATATAKPPITPTKEPTATAQAATPTPTQEPMTATPTPEDECLNEIIRELEGKIYIDCVNPHTPWPTPKYAILEDRINRFLVAAEESAKSSTGPGRTEAELHKVFIMISTSTDAGTKTLVDWLESNGVRHTNRTEADVGTIHSYRGHPQYYIYANVPAYLLGSLVHQEGIIRIDDGCHTAYFCWPQ